MENCSGETACLTNIFPISLQGELMVENKIRDCLAHLRFKARGLQCRGYSQ